MDSWDNQLMAAEKATKWWWVFLITGILWLIISLIVFRFNITSVGAVGVLVACFVILAGVNEFGVMAVTQGGWKWVHGILGGLFLVFGIFALFNPWDTFVAVAAIIGWVLLFKGALDIMLALMTRQQNELWWLQLVVGILEIALAFWASGYFGRKVILLIAWVGAWAMMRGITEIILAFQLRSLHKRILGGGVRASEGDLPPQAAGPEQAVAPA
jgi:uncharacterized membrane protein HdeD (DUF308 family)